MRIGEIDLHIAERIAIAYKPRVILIYAVLQKPPWFYDIGKGVYVN